MNWSFSQITDLFLTDNKSRLLQDGLWGIEKESQRVTNSGDLAGTHHPSVFGDKLSNPHITTDFSENQIELATSPFESIEEAYNDLNRLHQQVENAIGEELMWPLSMPPKLPDENRIPMAKFENTPEGREQAAYRSGLALRYGKKMQMISGIHYNFSFGSAMLDELHHSFGNGREKGDFTDELYVALTRNFLRYRWLLIYLFGASPSIDQTYHSVICKELKFIAECCPELCSPMDNYERYAASLRVSRFGYSNSDQVKDGMFLNNLQSYIQTIRKLLSTKSRKFTKLGIFQQDKQIQLNDNILQKESEFYSSIRLKHDIKKGETELDALEHRGVQYAEVRILDLNPFEKMGMSLESFYFMQVFMLFCLFEHSESIGVDEWEAMNRNHHRVSLGSRKPNLMLEKYDKGTATLEGWAGEIFTKLKSIASIMDLADQSSKYQDCVEHEYEKVLDSSLLPAALIYKEMMEFSESHTEFGIRRALKLKKAMQSEVGWSKYMK